MYKINKDQKRLPLGGHHYYEDGLMLRGETADEVASKLEKFRIDNNRSVGNPLQDVLKYYFVNFPWMVKEDDKPLEPEPTQYQEWRHWIQRTWVRPPKKNLTTKEATYRWDICKTCPHNVPISKGNNSSEFEQLTRKSFMLRRGSKIPSELGFCSLHHFDLGVASFIEIPKDHSEKKKDAQDYLGCWV